MGRPSKDLHVVIGVLLLQQLHDLSDAETVEALAFNMAWHYALDVRSEADSYFCEKTLRNYRRLFIVSRTRFPWTQNWLNRSVQGGPEHDR